MFNKLRNRFLILNLVIFSFIMLLAFATIYTITYQNVRNDIKMELHRVSEFYLKSSDFRDDSGPGGGGGGGMKPDGGNGEPPPERSVSFMVKTDGQGTVTSIDSKFAMDAGFYEEAAALTVAGGGETGQFVLDGNKWAYTIIPAGSESGIVCLDVTAQQKILTTLIYTFSAVAVGMLIVIFFTSRFFANRAIAPVREAFDKQKQFIADASHELKTPLAIINTNADVLLANGDESIDSQAKWLHRIKSETERMKTLTGDLLYLTEMDDARTSVMFAPFNASDSIESVILTMEASVYERNLSMDYDIEPDLMLHGNSEQIKQVVMILLDNAIKYSNSQGTITLSFKKRGHDLVLKVSNTGEGIAAEHLERIFDRFYRIDASRARKLGGYGLGLAIAKSIVEQHKGKISAKSDLGETTTFTIVWS